MAIKNKKRSLIGCILLTAILAICAFYVPISKGQYPLDEPQNSSSDTFEFVRYPMAIKIKSLIAHGSCDRVKVISSMADGKQVITITTPPQASICTTDLRHSKADIKVFSLPWQKAFTIKYSDRVLFNGRL